MNPVRPRSRRSKSSRVALASALVLSTSAALSAQVVVSPGGETSFETADGHSPPQVSTQFGAQCFTHYEETSGSLMSLVLGALPNARGSCVVDEYNDFSIAGDGFESSLLTQISGRVQAAGFLAMAGMGHIKSEVLIEVVDRGDDLESEADDVILKTHPAIVHELLSGIDVGVGVGASVDLGSLTALQGGLGLGVDFGIPLMAKSIHEDTDFGFQVLLERGRHYRIRTRAQVNLKLGVAGGFAIGSFHANQATMQNLFHPTFWLQTSQLPIADLDLADVTFPLASVDTLFTIPKIAFPGWDLTLDVGVDQATFTILPAIEILPATSIPNPLPYASVASVLQALGTFTKLSHFVESPWIGLSQTFASEDPIANIGTRVVRLDVLVEHDAMEEELRLLAERNLTLIGKKNPLATFQLPTAHGGHLEVARRVTMEAVAALKAAGLKVGPAEKHLDKAEAAFAAAQWKEAFQGYRKAYTAATH